MSIIEVPYEEYIKLFGQTSTESLSELLQYSIFKDYERDFNPDKEIEKIKNPRDSEERLKQSNSQNWSDVLLITYVR